MNNPGIVDTVRLYLPRDCFSFMPDKLNHCSQKRTINRVTGETYFLDKFYTNEPGINLTIYSRGLIIQLNAPYCVGRNNNLILADKDEIIFCTQAINKMLDKLEILGGEAVRFRVRMLDIAKNIRCKYPISFYKIVFDSLHFPRMNPKTDGFSFKLGNGQREIEFYDKSEQLRKKGFVIEEQNIMRCEVRLKTESEIQSNGIQFLDDLVERYEYLEAIYNNWINRILPEVNEIPKQDIVERKLDLIMKHGFRDAFKILGWAALIDVPKDQLKDALKEEYSTSQKHNLLRQRELIMPICHGLLSSSSSKYYKLYNELRDKLLHKQSRSSPHTIIV